MLDDILLAGCNVGLYGVDCKSECSDHCVVKGECDPVTGACVVSPSQARCEPGWTGDDCQTGELTGKKLVPFARTDCLKLMFFNESHMLSGMIIWPYFVGIK